MNLNNPLADALAKRLNEEDASTREDTDIVRLMNNVRMANTDVLTQGQDQPMYPDLQAMRAQTAARQSFGLARAKEYADYQLEKRQFGDLDDKIARGRTEGFAAPQDLEDIARYQNGIYEQDMETGQTVISDKRTLGWADASAATWWMTNSELARGITARSAANMKQTVNLMKGGARGYYEDRGLDEYQDDVDLRSIQISGAGWNVNPLNWSSTMDFFGLFDSPDLQALKYEDPNFNAKDYIANLTEIDPTVLKLAANAGLDSKALLASRNANEFWYKINSQFALNGAFEVVDTWKKNSPAHKRWALDVYQFVRDSFLNDPDFGGELAISGLLSLPTGGASVLAFGLANGARKLDKFHNAATAATKLAGKVADYSRVTQRALPNNWGLSIGQGLRNTQIGKFLDVSGKDLYYKGIRFGQTRKYGNKFGQYLFAELPAGFVEEGLAGAYNQYELNRINPNKARNILDAALQEGLAGSAMRAFLMNPALRGFNTAMGYTGALGLHVADEFVGKHLPSGNMGNFMSGLETFLDVVSGQNRTGTLQAKGQLLQLQKYFKDNNVKIDGQRLSSEDFKDAKSAMEKSPALAAIFEMAKTNEGQAILGGVDSEGNPKLMGILKEAVENSYRIKAGLNLDFDTTFTEDTTDMDGLSEEEIAKITSERSDARAEYETKMAKYNASKETGLTTAEYNRGILATFRNKMSAESLADFDNNMRMTQIFVTAVVDTEARRIQSKYKKEGREITAEEATLEVYAQHDLLGLLDDNEITAQINKSIQLKNPELFKTETTTDDAGVEESKLVPVSDEAAEQIRNIRRGLDFETLRAAVDSANAGRERKTDLRTLLDRVLQRELNALLLGAQTKDIGPVLEAIETAIEEGIPVSITINGESADSIPEDTSAITLNVETNEGGTMQLNVGDTPTRGTATAAESEAEPEVVTEPEVEPEVSVSRREVIEQRIDEINQLEAEAKKNKQEISMFEITERERLQEELEGLQEQTEPEVEERVADPEVEVTIRANNEASEAQASSILDTAATTADGEPLGKAVDKLKKDTDTGEILSDEDATPEQREQMVANRKEKKDYSVMALVEFESKLNEELEPTRRELERAKERLNKRREQEKDTTKVENQIKNLEEYEASVIRDAYRELSQESFIKFAEIDSKYRELGNLQESDIILNTFVFAQLEHMKEKSAVALNKIKDGRAQISKINNPTWTEYAKAYGFNSSPGRSKMAPLVLAAINENRKSGFLDHINDETQINQAEHILIQKTIEKAIRNRASEITAEDAQAIRLRGMFAEKQREDVERLLKFSSVDIEKALYGNRSEGLHPDKPFTGNILMPLSEAANISVDVDDQERKVLLSRDKQYKFIGKLISMVSNLKTIYDRDVVTEAELVSMAKEIEPAFQKLNFANLFHDAALEANPMEGTQYFDTDLLLEQLQVEGAKLDYILHGNLTAKERLEVLRNRMIANPEEASPEFLLQDALELAARDAEAMRLLGREMFTSGPSDIRGRYIISTTTETGKFKTHESAEEYEKAVAKSIQERLAGLSNKQKEQVAIFIRNNTEIIRESRTTEEGQQAVDLTTGLLQFLQEYARENSEIGEISDWGDGKVGYQPADQLGRGIVDLASGKQEGTTRHQFEKFVDRDESGQIITEEFTRDEVKGKTILGAVRNRNHYSPMTRKNLERLLEDSRAKVISEFLAGVDLSKEQVDEVFEWLETEKEALEKITDDVMNGGEMYFPSVLTKSPFEKLKDAETLVDIVYQHLIDLDAVLTSYEHDSMFVGAKVSGFGDIEAIDKLVPSIEDADGNLIRPSTYWKDVGAAGGFRTAVTSPGSDAMALNAGWEAIHPAFMGITEMGLLGFASLAKSAKAVGNITSSKELLDKKTSFFDGQFNGIHQKMAIMMTYSPPGTIFNISNSYEFNPEVELDHDKVDAYDRYLKRYAEKFGAKFGEDYYSVVASQVLNRIATEAFRDGAAAQTEAMQVIDFLKEIKVLPEDINKSNFKEVLSQESISDNSLPQHGLRKIMKKPVMINLYGAGKEKILASISTGLFEEHGRDDDAARQVAEALRDVSYGLGIKIRQMAMTDLAQAALDVEEGRLENKEILLDAVGDPQEIRNIIKAMRDRMATTDYNADRIREIVDDMTGFLQLNNTDVIYNTGTFQLMSNEALIEEVLQSRLGLQPGTDRYNSAKERLRNKSRIAREYIQNDMRKRINNELKMLAENDDSGEIAKELNQFKEDRFNLTEEIIARLSTRNDSELKVDPRVTKYIELVRDVLSQPMTPSQFKEIKDKMIKDVDGFDPAIVRGYQRLNLTGRKRDASRSLAMTRDGEHDWVNPDYYDNMTDQVTYRGQGPDLAAGRMTYVDHPGSFHATKGAKMAGWAEGDDYSMGVMEHARSAVEFAESMSYEAIKARREQGLEVPDFPTQEDLVKANREYVRKMFAKNMLLQLSRFITDVRNPLQQIAEDAGNQEIALMLKQEKTNEEKAMEQFFFLKRFFEMYKGAKSLEPKILAILEQRDNPDLDDPAEMDLIRAKISYNYSNKEGLDPKETKMMGSLEEFMKTMRIVVQDAGAFAMAPKFSHHSFLDVGIPEFKILRLKQRLGQDASVSKKITTLDNWKESFDILVKSGVESDNPKERKKASSRFDFVNEDTLDNLHAHSFDPDVLMDTSELNLDLETTDITGMTIKHSAVAHSRRLESDLFKYARANNLLDLYQSDDIRKLQRLKFLMDQDFIIQRYTKQYEATLAQYRHTLEAAQSRPAIEYTQEQYDEDVKMLEMLTRKQIYLDTSALWQRKTDEDNAEFYSTEFAPRGHVGTITRNKFLDKDGNSLDIATILRNLATPQNNLGGFGTFPIFAYVPVEKDGILQKTVNAETRMVPLTPHNHDVAHIILTVLKHQSTPRFFTETERGKKLLVQIKDRIGKPNLSDQDFLMEPAFYLQEDNAMTEDELIELAQFIRDDEVTLGDTNISGIELFPMYQNFRFRDGEFIRAAGNDDIDVSQNFGTGIKRVEAKHRGSTERYFLTMSQAVIALNAARNAPLMQDINLAYLSNMENYGRPKTGSTYHSQTDHQTGEALHDIKLREELDAEAMRLIEIRRATLKQDPKFVDPATAEVLPARTRLQTVVAGRENSVMQFPRQLPKALKKNRSFPIFLDQKQVGEAELGTKTPLLSKVYGLHALIQKLELDKIDIKDIDTNLFKEQFGLNIPVDDLKIIQDFNATVDLSKNKKIGDIAIEAADTLKLVGYALKYGSSMMTPSQAIIHAAYQLRELDLIKVDTKNRTITTAEEVAKQRVVKDAIKYFEVLSVIDKRNQLGETSRYFEAAQGFVFNLIENPTAALRENENDLISNFNKYLKTIDSEPQSSEELEDAVKALRRAVREIYAPGIIHTQDSEVPSTTIPSVEEVLKRWSKADSSAAIKGTIVKAVKDDVISEATGEVLQVVLAKLTALNPDILNDLRLEFGADIASSEMSGYREADTDKYVLRLSTKDGKKHPLTVAKIMIHEIVHMGSMKFFDTDIGSQDLSDIYGLMNNTAVEDMMFSITKVLAGKQGGFEAAKRHRHYMSNPHEFLADAAAHYWLSESTAEIDQILENYNPQNDILTETNTEDKAKVQSFAAKLKSFINRIINQSRNMLLSVKAIMGQFRDKPEFNAEFKKLEYLSHKAIGIDIKTNSTIKPNRLKENMTLRFDGASGVKLPITPGPLSEKDMLNIFEFKQRMSKIILTKENYDAYAKQMGAMAETYEDIEKSIDEAGKLLEEGGAYLEDELGVTAIDRARAEQELEAQAETIEGRQAVDYDNARLNIVDQRVLDSIVLHRFKQYQGAEFKSMNALQKAATVLGMDPAQSRMTHDSKYPIVRMLSRVVDAEGILTDNLLTNGEGTSDLISANLATRNNFALIKGMMSRFNNDADVSLMMEFLIDPTKEPSETETSAHEAAQQLREQFNRVLFIAKKSGFLFDKLDYNPIPLKLSPEVSNLAPLEDSLSRMIARRIQNSSKIDPLTLAMSDLLPRIYNRRNNLGQLSSRFDTAAQNAFQDKIAELQSTEKGRDVLNLIIQETREKLDERTISLQFKRLNAENVLDLPIQQLVLLEHGLHAIYKQAFQTQGFSNKNAAAIVAYVKDSENIHTYRTAANKDLDQGDHQIYLKHLTEYKEFNLNTMRNTSKLYGEAGNALMRSVALFRAKLFLSEVGTGARFLANDRPFDPDPAELIAASMGVDGMLSETDASALKNSFVHDPMTLMDSVTTGLAFDAQAAESMAKMTMHDKSKLPIVGIRFDKFVEGLKEYGVASELHPTVSRSSISDSQDFKAHLNVLVHKYNTLAGRAQRIDITQSGTIPNRAAAMGRDLVLALYGGNLTLATAAVEGILSGLSIMQRGDLVLGPASLAVDIFKGMAKGAFSGVAQGVQYASGGKINIPDPLSIKNTAAELTYAHDHAHIQGISREETDDTFVSDSVMDKVGRFIGVMKDISTSSALGVQNNIKYHLEGLSIFTLTRLLKSGAWQRLIDVAKSERGQEILSSNLEEMDPSIMREKFRLLIKETGVSDFGFLRGQTYRILFDMQMSGLLAPDTLDTLAKLISKTKLAHLTHDSRIGTYDATESALSHIGELQKAALFESDPNMREKFFGLINGLKRFVNKEIESRFVGGNPMVSDTTNNAFGVLIKLFRSYPTNFFAQRMRRDSRFYNPVANVVRLINLMAHDIMYMVLTEIAKTGYDEKRLDMMMNELQDTKFMMRMISRTPTFGVYGGFFTNFLSEMYIGITTGKGYTGNMLNQMFIPVPAQKLQSVGNNIIKFFRAAYQDNEDSNARQQLALLNVLQSIPLFQEYFVRAAIGMYLPDAANDLATENMRRNTLSDRNRKSRSGSRSQSRGIHREFFSNPTDWRSMPFDPTKALERGIHPLEMQTRDMLSILAGSELQSLIAPPERMPQPEQAPEATTPPPQEVAPQAAPEAPQTPPTVSSAAGSTPSERLAESL